VGTFISANCGRSALRSIAVIPVCVRPERSLAPARQTPPESSIYDNEHAINAMQTAATRLLPYGIARPKRMYALVRSHAARPVDEGAAYRAKG
jgi:hypothetical protein